MPLDPDLTEFTTASPFIVSYDYNDISEGTGIITFYGSSSYDTTNGQKYLLTRNQNIFSNNIALEVNGTACTAWTKHLDLDYDIKFNTQKIVKGTGFVTCCFATVAGAPAPNNYIIAKVRHYDGSTETDLVTSQTATVSNSTKKNTRTLKVIIPRQVFAVGDILRLTIEVWGQRDGGNPNYVSIGSDPKNRDWTSASTFTDINPSSDSPTSTTQLVFQCPFETQE